MIILNFERKNFTMKKIFLLLTAIFLAQCDSQNTPKDTLVVGREMDDLVSLDPAEVYEVTSTEYILNTYDTLIVRDYDKPENILPCVAESWSVSTDGKSITFKIRKGIQFHSGNVLSAYDVVYSLQRAIVLRKEPSEIIAQFGINPENVKDKIVAIDDYTVQFKMDKAYAPTLVLNCLTAPVGAIVDSKLLQSHEVNGDYGNKWLKTNEAGSGPFKLKAWKASESLVFEANIDHWKTIPKLTKVIIRHINDPSTGRIMLEKKDLDIVCGLKYEQAEQIKDVELVQVPVMVTRYLSLNQKNKNLTIPEVRQAIRYAIDYDTLVKTLFKGDVIVQQSFLPKGFPYALTDRVYSLDLEKAKNLMKQAELEEGFDINLVTNNKDFAQALQADLAKINIRLHIDLGDQKQTLTRIRERNFDMAYSAWSPDFFDPHMNAMSFAKNIDNADESRAKTVAWRMAWHIPELTKLTEKAMIERDPAEREKMYHRIQKELYSSPIINLFQNLKTYVYQKNVKGVIFSSAVNLAYYHNAYKD
jgi:peptide/nickel transport system substrate-binding protein